MVKKGFITGSVETEAGPVPRVSPLLSFKDRLGGWRVRWNINRIDYIVKPGLYAVGRPGKESPVLVSANYKLSFDILRTSLKRYSAWILVLDTKGINVWCAAGKGTFGTGELVDRIDETKLDRVVDHEIVIVPQLGAPGISAHDVKKFSGFKVVYGPVRVRDIPEFLKDGMNASPDMRKVTFTLRDRLVLSPVEMVNYFKYTAIAIIVFILTALLGKESFSTVWYRPVLFVLGGYFSGALLVPALLPWLPGRAFSLKGVWPGLLSALLLITFLFDGLHGMESAGWVLIAAAFSSFIGMNFTGASTYTSLSGVRKEMITAIPLQIVSAAVGIVFWIISRFV